MAKNKQILEMLDQFHWHEALDRTHIICENIDNNLLQHPVCKLDKEVSKKVDQALTTLYEAYQLMGERTNDI
jgi:hypothetical protein